MQIKLGEKIREYRRRAGLRQEDLASALGVTGQAVSRWEAVGGYPDIEMLPAIANYFHVTIDELFGYQGERAEKLNEICDRAEKLLSVDGNTEACVELLRSGLLEFPNEGELIVLLGFALTQLGRECYGIKGNAVFGTDYTQFDAAYNGSNLYFREATALFERALQMDIAHDDRLAVTTNLAILYLSMGEKEKAIAIAEKQDPVLVAKEVFLASASDGERCAHYCGEALLALMFALRVVIVRAIGAKVSLAKSEKGAEKLLAVIALYESILDDGNCGEAHAEIGYLYALCAVLLSRTEDSEQALQYFDLGFTHMRAYVELSGSGQRTYTAPLVAGVKYNSDTLPVKAKENAWLEIVMAAGEELQKAIRKNEKYAVYFGE